MTNFKHIAMRRHPPWPNMMNHNAVMRRWAQQHAGHDVVERVYWSTHLAIYSRLNEGPIHCLFRWYLPLESRLPRWDR